MIQLPWNEVQRIPCLIMLHERACKSAAFIKHWSVSHKNIQRFSKFEQHQFEVGLSVCVVHRMNRHVESKLLSHHEDIFDEFELARIRKPKPDRNMFPDYIDWPIQLTCYKTVACGTGQAILYSALVVRGSNRDHKDR